MLSSLTVEHVGVG